MMEDQPGSELIVVLKGTASVKITPEGVPIFGENAEHPLSNMFLPGTITLRPLFGMSAERLLLRTLVPGVPDVGTPSQDDLPNLSNYFQVQAPIESLEKLAIRLIEYEDVVEAAYVKPSAVIPQGLNDMVPSSEEPPTKTPDFTTDQLYLAAGPGGIDALYAWQLEGGRGNQVSIIDIEGAWHFTHEDLLRNQGGIAGGDQQPALAWRNHGTSVVGVIGGDNNGFGITGICSDANIRALAAYKVDTNGNLVSNSATMIRQAADMLSPGDIILIELHRPGPRNSFSPRSDQQGYIAIEWWPDDFAAIAYATARGIIVVEAAGNGGENLDDNIYDSPPASPYGSFPSWWRNPLRRGPTDSGAILVGAGAPPPGTHGRNLYGADRSRLDFSNFGSIIDAQGWGREVTTTGYGDKQGGLNEDLWYTDTFSGTSSASPMIVGALTCVQGILHAAGIPPLTPARARECLRVTGSPQEDTPGRPTVQRIGNRPDLKQLVKFVRTYANGPEKPAEQSRIAQRIRTVRQVRETKEVKLTRETNETIYF